MPRAENARRISTPLDRDDRYTAGPEPDSDGRTDSTQAADHQVMSRFTAHAAEDPRKSGADQRIHDHGCDARSSPSRTWAAVITKHRSASMSAIAPRGLHRARSPQAAHQIEPVPRQVDGGGIRANHDAMLLERDLRSTRLSHG